MRVYGSSRGPARYEGELMMLTLAIETSQPSGKKFRLALGLSLPLALVGWLLTLFG